MRAASLITLFSILTFSVYAEDMPKMVFQEQTPLSMAVPNTGNTKQIRWIPLSSNPHEVIQKTAPAKTIDDSIKTEIQKKIQTLLKPINDDEGDH